MKPATGLLVIAIAFAGFALATHHSTIDDDPQPQAVAVAAQAYPTNPPIVPDSDDLKQSEATFFAEHTAATSASVGEYSDCTLNVHIDADAWDTLSAQDRTIEQQGWYRMWRAAYFAHHKTQIKPCRALSLRVLDLTGKEIASYE